MLLSSVQNGYIAADIIAALGGSSLILGIFSMFFFRKENRKIKGEKVEQSKAETESKNIANDSAQLKLMQTMQDIVQKTWDNQMLMSTQLTEMTSEKMSQTEQMSDLINSVELVKKDVAEVKKDIKEVKERQTFMEQYLNGPYHEWLEKNLKKITLE